MKRFAFAALALSVSLSQSSTRAQSASGLRAIQQVDVVGLRSVDAQIQSMVAAGDLQETSSERDALLPNHTVERLAQFHNGVPVFGGEVVRETADGLTTAVFGLLASGFSEAAPRLNDSDVLTSLSSGSDLDIHIIRSPTLVYFASEERAAYAYTVTYSNQNGVWTVVLSADTGAELLRFSEIRTDAAIGTGRGVLGDLKKLSTSRESGQYFADDKLRPPSLVSFDMRGNLAKSYLVAFFNDPLFVSDRAASNSQTWSDPVAVDAQAQLGLTYDYYYQRFGRRGLDNRDRPLLALIHPVAQSASTSLIGTAFEDFVDNAFWCGACGPNKVGLMAFGEGLPDGVYFTLNNSIAIAGKSLKPLAGALDVIGHELTHGVTESSSRLLPSGEPGALDESFSDMMGTSVEFYYQPPGSGLGRADYLMGEDVVRAVLPGALDGLRSLQNPTLYGDPDHYSRRYIGSGDSGGRHTNSLIPSHAFYLAIEGGTNRTSGVAVQGVGSAKRQQIEAVFYRAFTLLLPSNATFSIARAATIQSARDLYGAGSAVEQAVTAGWTAVGVN